MKIWKSRVGVQREADMFRVYLGNKGKTKNEVWLFYAMDENGDMFYDVSEYVEGMMRIDETEWEQVYP